MPRVRRTIKINKTNIDKRTKAYKTAMLREQAIKNNEKRAIELAIKEQERIVRKLQSKLVKAIDALNRIKNNATQRRQENAVSKIAKAFKKYKEDKANKTYSYTLYFLAYISPVEKDEYLENLPNRRRQRRQAEFIKNYRKLRKVQYHSRVRMPQGIMPRTEKIEERILNYSIDQGVDIEHIIKHIDYLYATTGLNFNAFLFEDEQVNDKRKVARFENEKYHNNQQGLPSSKYIKMERLEENADGKLVQDSILPVAPFACCYDILIHYFKQAFEKNFNRSKKSAGKQFDLQFLQSFFGKDGSDYGLTINEFLQFFIHYNLFLVIHSIDGKILLEHRPTNLNKGYGKEGLHLIAYNNHLTAITNNLHSIKLTGKKDAELLKKPSAFFTLKKDDADELEHKKVIMLKASDEAELLKILFSIKRSCRIIFDGDIIDAIKLLMKSGIHPQVSSNITDITSISLFFTEKHTRDDGKEEEYQIYISIETPNTIPTMTSEIMDVITNEDLLQYQTIQNQFEIMLFKKEYSSDRSDDMKQIDTKCPKPLCMAFGDKIIDCELSAVDMNKSYASNLCSFDRLGVFNLFSSIDDIEFKIEELVETAFYVCRFTDDHICDEDLLLSYNCYFVGKQKIEDRHLFITSGFELKEIYGNTISPLEVLQAMYPYKSVENPVASKMQNLFSDKVKLPTVLKKNIPNILVGKTGKTTKKARRTYLDSNVNALKRHLNELKNTQGFNSKIVDPFNILPSGKDKLYLATEEVSTELNNGFFPITLYVMMRQRTKLWTLFKFLKHIGVKAYGCRTDCIYINEAELTQQQLQHIQSCCNADRFGGVKYQEKKPVKICRNWNLTEEEIDNQLGNYRELPMDLSELDLYD